MGTRVGLETRLRNRVGALESEKVRPKIEAALAEICNKTPCNQDIARDRFFYFCQQGAKERGLKFFAKGTDGEGRQGYRQSLALLLGEKIAPASNGKFYTETNSLWVVEVWKAGLDRYYHRKEFGLARSKEVASAAVEETEQCGVRILLEEEKETETASAVVRPLSLRVLEAFTKNDSTGMTALILEIEKLEGGK